MASSYLGIHTQIRQNNRKSVQLLIAFPLLLLAVVFAAIASLAFLPEDSTATWDDIWVMFFSAAPYVILITTVWFLVAYFSHSKIINSAVHSQTLERRDNMRVYNLTENLCMELGMTMPKLRIIEDKALNAFASGLSEKTYTVTLTRGIINVLDDEELKGVIAHELMHIRNRDVRLLVISIIFVGIFSLLVQILFRSILYGGHRRRGNDNKGGGAIIVIMIIVVIAYFLSMLFRFALSRKREYMADAGAAEITKNPRALASALRKISGNSHLESIDSEDVKEMFIDNYPDNKDEGLGFMGGMDRWFATHPPIEKRIQVLEQF